MEEWSEPVLIVELKNSWRENCLILYRFHYHHINGKFGFN